MIRFEKWSLLALMRFLLASIVAINHLAEYADLGFLKFVPYFGPFEAILGFLLISGYSIGESYTKNPAGFYKRRAARLYPIYVASAVLVFIATPEPVTLGFLGVVVINLLFLNQALTTGSYVGPAWSLALEAWLYTLTPWLAKLSSRKLLGLVFGSLFCYAVHTCGRTLFHWPYYSGLGYGLNLFTLGFAWIAGFLLARERKNPVATMRMIGAIYIFHLSLTMAIAFGYRLKNHQLALFVPNDLVGFVFKTATLIFVWVNFNSMLKNQDKPSVKSHFMRFLGDVSYPLYVVHISVYVILARYGFKNPYLMLLIAIAASAAVYQTLDFYSRRRDRKEFPSQPVPKASEA